MTACIQGGQRLLLASPLLIQESHKSRSFCVVGLEPICGTCRLDLAQNRRRASAIGQPEPTACDCEEPERRTRGPGRSSSASGVAKDFELLAGSGPSSPHEHWLDVAQGTHAGDDRRDGGV